MSANQKNTTTYYTVKKNQTVADQSINWGSQLNSENSEKFNVELLRTMEVQLKEIWSHYISYLDKNGFDETAQALKSKYFRIYQNYQKNKNWRSIVIKN